jgi:hypothetical protein
LNGIVADDARNKLSRDLERIFEQQCDLVFRTAYALTGSTADAEDIVQTIFMRLLASEVPPDHLPGLAGAFSIVRATTVIRPPEWRVNTSQRSRSIRILSREWLPRGRRSPNRRTIL